MEVKEAERIVIAKPVPSKPTCSNFGSFSDLLAGAINSSPTKARPETAVTAIRPKTVRFKPATTRAPVAVVSSQGNSNISHQQALAQVEARVQTPNPFKSNFRSDLSLTFQPNFSSQAEREKTTEPSNIALENTEGGQKSLPPTSSVDRPSYDGYNWRKYGQKQVKGSEYPRSYYKCTHPNCQVKKKVERSLDGQIAEIVYKGEHNHSKPQPLKRNASGGQGQGFVSDGIVQETNNAPSWSNKLNERIEGFEGRIENQNEVGLSTHSTYSGKAPPSYDHVGGRAVNTGLGTPEHSCGLSGDCEDGSKGLEAEDDEPKSKRRKNENELGMSGEGVQDPPAVVQNSPDPEIIGDGFRWRKYGQKVVKGNPYPRSYYRCTNPKCNVRKHVERASDDPTAFVTTYEGKHNHDMPVKTMNPASSEPDSQAATSKGKP
ncbi:WRKY transcription factor 44-like isoform X2 [Camellia sinensis]|uniref:WRKY transcription factor 44-like isoform X2 n=1 Tax=Camellia sinensis TaxID=4442 RepID=UPI001036BE2B|nr:WRKY transcription factor 44-like isoform X2 [Camellia sinensis]